MHFIVYIKLIFKVAFPSCTAKDCVAMNFKADPSVYESLLVNLSVRGNP